MSYETLSFPEALSYLARKAGVRVEEFRTGDPAQRSLTEKLLSLHAAALDYYRQNLGASKRALTYLSERGIDSDTAEGFGLGYSPHARDSLFVHLQQKGFAAEDIKPSGLVHYGEQGPFDFFRDRVMFPIFDLQGRPVAFGGRLLADMKNAPKYINSPDSPLFKKGETLYGLSQAKSQISQKGYALLVEGYLDVITCHHHGFRHAVAPLGTALTAGHLKKLKRFSSKVLLVFDGDAAGRAATRRSLDLVYPEAMTAKILILPQGEDPDSFLRREGAEAFRKSLSKAVSPVDFVLGCFGRNKLDAVRSVLTLLANCPDLLLREETLKEVAERSRINEQLLREELANLLQKTRSKQQIPRSTAESPGRIEGFGAPHDKEERLLLAIALSIPEMTGNVLKNIERLHFDNPAVQGVFDKIKRIASEKGFSSLSVEGLLRECTEEEQTLVTSQLIEAEVDSETVGRTMTDCVRRLALRGLERQITFAEQKGDERRLQELLSEKARLLSQRS
jgi:DNA primase